MDIEQPRYDGVAVALHWLIGVALLGEIAFGFLLDDIAPRGTPARAAVINLHKSSGLVLLALIVVRLAWWLGHAPPPWPDSMPPWQRRAARLRGRSAHRASVSSAAQATFRPSGPGRRR